MKWHHTKITSHNTKFSINLLHIELSISNKSYNERVSIKIFAIFDSYAVAINRHMAIMAAVKTELQQTEELTHLHTQRNRLFLYFFVFQRCSGILFL